ncbi:MAG TPA: choice-of-anchor tandem repeat GloVer-containing protein [Candidatus Acidoferrum sp.]|nr:choice-of-anchor tandem repeat GloVer-containing protein [Candidatus Acidoferrum sp.]
MNRAIVVVAACCSLIAAGCSQGPATSPPMHSTQAAVAPKITRYQVLNSFNGTDEGAYPTGSITSWLKLLYGTASGGGKYGFGAIFRARPDGKDNYPLHYFDGKQEGCTPMGGVTFGYRSSIFYGTTKSCGNSTKGGTIWSEHISSRNIEVLHAFDLASDGGNPESAPVQVGDTLYGTTRNGGAHGRGTLYRIDMKTAAFKVVHAFGEGTDAGYPMGGLVELGGKLYGTSYVGGSLRLGTVYEFDPKNDTEEVLHEFNGDDGERPTVPLLSWDGALYGVTPIGGARFAGTIFKIDPANGNETTLYNFGNDAFAPDGSLIMWKDALYGTTRRGGKSGKDLGTIFRYTPGTNKFDELYAFGGKPDGAHPRGGLLFLNVDRQDQFFGTTYDGGKEGLGTIFSMTP